MADQVIRRVLWHGFRCATQVVAAWQAGQHADARELTALYISSDPFIQIVVDIPIGP